MSESTPYQSSEVDRPRFPDVESEIGEDPARFLYVGRARIDDVEDVDDAVNIGDTPPLALAITRIRGIDSLEVIDAWVRVEEQLGPRQKVMAALMQRKTALQASSQTDAPTVEVPADA